MTARNKSSRTPSKIAMAHRAKVESIEIEDIENFGDCHHCGAPCGPDAFCSGCKAFICPDCDHHQPTAFVHVPEDHQPRTGPSTKQGERQ